MRTRFKTLAIVVGVAAMAGASLGLTTPAVLAAEEFPNKPVRLIVPWPAGGGSDTAMRLVADAAEKYLGQPIIVENRPGAGGAEGTRVIENAEPDGYTIGMVGSGVVARHYSNPNASDYNDLQPIVFFGAEPGALSAHPDTGFEAVEDFVEAAKAEPGSIVNGNDQPGGSSYIVASVMENQLGIELTKVPYEGFAPTVIALIGGEIQTATVPVADVIEHHNAGTLKLLGIADERRHFLAPDVPTFKEQGYDLVIGSWRIILGPKGIAEDRLTVLEEALLEALSDPEFVKRANAAGFAISPMGSEETTGFLHDYAAMLYPILKDAGLVETRQRD